MRAGETDSKAQKQYISSPSGPFGALKDKLLEILHAAFPHKVHVGRSGQTISVALIEPWRAFAHPEEVLAARGLSSNEKKRILERWAEDARALSIADDEGLSGGEPNRLADVMQAKGEIETPNKRDRS